MRSPVANGQVINRATYDSSPIVQDSARVETPGHDYLGDDIDLDTLGLDDKATSELLGRGDTLGVFQLDGGAMRDLPRRMRPTGFEAKGRVNWRDDKMSIFGSGVIPLDITDARTAAVVSTGRWETMPIPAAS